MRVVTLLLAVLCAAAPAQEKAKPRKRVGHAEFERLLDEAEAKNDTTAKREAATKALCDGYEVLQKAKILDVKEDGGYAAIETWSVDLGRRWGNVFVEDGAAAALKWGRWDRLWWVSVPVYGSGDITLQPLSARAADFHREPNPGPPEIPQVADAPDFGDKLAAAVQRAKAGECSWEEPLRILTDANGKAESRRVEMVRRSEVHEDYESDVELETTSLRIRDPQIAEALRPGTKAEVASVVRVIATSAADLSKCELWDGLLAKKIVGAGVYRTESALVRIVPPEPG